MVTEAVGNLIGQSGKYYLARDKYEIVNTTNRSKGATKNKTVSSYNPSAYPTNSYSGSIWYVRR